MLSSGTATPIAQAPTVAQPLQVRLDSRIAELLAEIASHNDAIAAANDRILLLQQAKGIATPQLQALVDKLGLDIRVP
jgi:uncharacterized coiled-coil protein SlyX